MYTLYHLKKRHNPGNTGNPYYVASLHLAAVGEDGSEDKKKVAILLTVVGAEPLEAQEVFRTFTYEPAKVAVGDQPAVPAETAEQFNTVMRKFTEFCVPRKNVIYERYVFHTWLQGECKTYDR